MRYFPFPFSKKVPVRRSWWDSERGRKVKISIARTSRRRRLRSPERRGHCSLCARTEEKTTLTCSDRRDEVGRDRSSYPCHLTTTITISTRCYNVTVPPARKADELACHIKKCQNKTCFNNAPGKRRKEKKNVHVFFKSAHISVRAYVFSEGKANCTTFFLVSWLSPSSLSGFLEAGH